MAMFNSYIKLPEGIYNGYHHAINIFWYILPKKTLLPNKNSYGKSPLLMGK